MFRLLAGSCNDGPCPNFWINVRTGDVLVQGYKTSLRPPGAVPVDEDVLHIPAEAWKALLRNLGP